MAATAGAKVTVACKIAVAWFDLQLCKEETVYENTQTGPREIKQWVRFGDVVRIRGTAYPRGTPPEGFPAKATMVAGYALTYGVDKAFFDEWLKQNARAPYVLSKMIFAHESADHIRGIAKERAGLTSGIEPLRTDVRDPRVPRSSNKGVTDVETEENRRARVVATEDA